MSLFVYSEIVRVLLDGMVTYICMVATTYMRMDSPVNRCLLKVSAASKFTMHSAFLK